MTSEPMGKSISWSLHYGERVVRAAGGKTRRNSFIMISFLLPDTRSRWISVTSRLVMEGCCFFFPTQLCSQQILVKPLLHWLPHSPSQAQQGAIHTKISVDSTKTSCTYTLKPSQALLWGGIKRNKATSCCLHSLEPQRRNNGCLCLGKIVICLIMSNGARWRARRYISTALNVIRTYLHVLSGG